MFIEKKKFLKYTKCKGSSGINLSKYYDFIQLFFDKKNISRLETYISGLLPCNLIGIELFGTLLVSRLSSLFINKLFNGLFILKKRKHGAREKVYGNINPELRTYIIDDVITSGKTIRYSLDVLKKHGIIPDVVLCIKNRSPFLKIRNILIYEL